MKYNKRFENIDGGKVPRSTWYRKKKIYIDNGLKNEGIQIQPAQESSSEESHSSTIEYSSTCASSTSSPNSTTSSSTTSTLGPNENFHRMQVNDCDATLVTSENLSLATNNTHVSTPDVDIYDESSPMLQLSNVVSFSQENNKSVETSVNNNSNSHERTWDNDWHDEIIESNDEDFSSDEYEDQDKRN